MSRQRNPVARPTTVAGILAAWILVWALVVAPALSLAHVLSHQFDATHTEDCPLCLIAGQATGAGLPLAGYAVADDRVAVLSPHASPASTYNCLPEPSARGPPTTLN